MFISFFHKILTSSFCFSDRGFCSNPENYPVRAIHKCNLGLCGHFVRCEHCAVTASRSVVGSQFPGRGLALLLVTFTSCSSVSFMPKSSLPTSFWILLEFCHDGSPEPLLYLCGLARWYCPCCWCVWPKKRKKKKKKLHLVKATDQGLVPICKPLLTVPPRDKLLTSSAKL